jgi:hypothetical protein
MKTSLSVYIVKVEVSLTGHPNIVIRVSGFCGVDGSIVKLCKIRGFHLGDYEEWRLLGWYAMWRL